MKFIKYGAPIILSASLLLTGCIDLDVEPTDKFTDATYWTSEDKANSVVAMGYRQMFDSKYIFNDEILSDNVYNGYGTTDEKSISTGIADASTGRFAKQWEDYYGGIKTCHTFLANIDRITDIDEEVKQNRIAEIRFIRAYLYFQLTTWYGDVPHFTEDISLEQGKTVPRKPQSEIQAWVHQELEDIAEILSTREEYADKDRGRVTAGAAIALNARAYLYENNYAKVAEYTDKLVNSTKYGSYSLFPDYEKLFWVANEYNEEIILDYQFVPELRLWSNLVDFAPMSADARLCSAAPTQGLVDSYLMLNGEKWTTSDPDYANRDTRMGATIAYDGSKWIDRSGNEYTIVTHPDGTVPDGKKSDKFTGAGTAQTATGYYYRKFCDPSPTAYKGGGWDSNLNLPLIRFADVLLMYAEAKNELGQMDNTVWNQTIKLLRQRAKFNDVPKAMNMPSTDKGTLRDVIRNERRCELALEGLRIFDLRRWRTAEVVLREPFRGAKFDKSSGSYQYIQYAGGNFSKDRDYLWAIPRKEIILNKNLTQNPGY
ncbi:RagB/SusD family nutrient uptake outer membrane protein [Dysgonomonas sp. ZJ709]|uniref:RagB/SusD family nutrient uptake outer membrane protein n=1 Tax=Dysgonomonas sp. ZJ709 TaxID=2709797 RepID=UPI001C86CC2B|nr:RagB/SusD family nutrient uptake outer membrane protein [Dysgonomonas sp. ZJ709]